MKKIIVVILLFCMFLNMPLYAANYIGYKTYLKAVLLQKNGKTESAKNEYENVIACDKTAIAAYRELVNIYWQTGSNQKALDTAEIMRELDGDTVKTNMFLGTFYLTANEMLLAKKAWEKVLELEPENETATVYLAAYYYSDNKLQESVDYWNRFLQQQPESAEGYFQLGLVQEKLGKLDEAIESYKKTNELKPDAREAYLARARIYETKKQYDLAVSEYEKYTEFFPDNLSVLLYLSKCYFEEQKYAKSEETLMKAKKISPSNMTIYYLLGIIYEKNRDIPKAIDTFEYIVKKEPAHASFARLGYYYALNRDFKSADKNFNKAIDLDPFNPEYFYFAGLNSIDAKKYDKAEKYLSKSLLFNPDNINAKFYLATVYAECKKYESAEQLLDEILTAEPDNAKVLNYLGYMYAENNIKLDKAEKLLTKAVGLAPNDPAFLDSLAWLYYRTGKFEEAEKYIARATNTKPQIFDKTIYEHFGDISVELGKLSEAYFYYAVSKDIGSSDAGKKMNLIEKKYPAEEINKVIPKIAVHNFTRLFALKGSYKLKIKKNSFKINSLASVVYAKNHGLKLDFIQNFTVPGFSVLFSGGQYVISPDTAAKAFDGNIADIAEFINFILSEKFVDFISEASVKQKGKKITVYNDEYSFTVDRKKGYFTELAKKGVMHIKLSGYKHLNTFSAVPGKIDFYSDKYKFLCESKLNKINSLGIDEFYNFEQGFNKNEDTGTGKN